MIQDMLMEQKGINELIDTLWNVNNNNIWCYSGFTLELIDTLWNVNDLHVGDGEIQVVN